MRNQQREVSGERCEKTRNISFYTSRDLLELIDMSADHNGLSRSAEVRRLLEIALERPPSDVDSAATEVTGHIV